jgi:hypothetical protein
MPTELANVKEASVPEHAVKLLGHRSVTTTERHDAKWVKRRQGRLDTLVSVTWAKLQMSCHDA